MTAVYIFSFITGIMTLNETLPFTLGMNIRRKDYYSSSMLTFGILSLILSILLTVFSRIESWFSDQLTNHLAFFSSPFIYANSAFQTDTMAKVWITHVVFLLFIFNWGYFIAAIYNRFGKTGMFTMSTLLLLFILVTSVFQKWGTLLEWLSFIDSLGSLLLLIAGIAVVFSGTSYVLLKRSIVRT